MSGRYAIRRIQALIAQYFLYRLEDHYNLEGYVRQLLSTILGISESDVLDEEVSALENASDQATATQVAAAFIATRTQLANEGFSQGESGGTPTPGQNRRYLERYTEVSGVRLHERQAVRVRERRGRENPQSPPDRPRPVVTPEASAPGIPSGTRESEGESSDDSSGDASQRPRMVNTIRTQPQHTPSSQHQHIPLGQQFQYNGRSKFMNTTQCNASILLTKRSSVCL